MITQDIDFTRDFPKASRISDYVQLRKISCGINKQARALAIYELSGLKRFGKGRRLIGLITFIICLLFPYSTYGQGLAAGFSFTIERFYQDPLNTPMGIFVDKEAGEVYVADRGRNEVLIFDTKGTPIFRFGKVNGVSAPFDLVVKNNRIYLSQEGKPYVEIFNYRGESIGRLAPEGVPFLPGRLAVDEDGNIYVVNKVGTNCLVFNSRGKFVGSIGKGLSSITGVEVAGDRVYLITPFDDHAIKVYDKNGDYILGFEGLEERGGTLGLPVSAKMDIKGRLWLVDALKGIIIYDITNGNKELTRFGKYGTAKGQFFFPVDIDFGRKHMVYFVEKGAKRVSVFRIEVQEEQHYSGE